MNTVLQHLITSLFQQIFIQINFVYNISVAYEVLDIEVFDAAGRQFEVEALEVFM